MRIFRKSNVIRNLFVICSIFCSSVSLSTTKQDSTSQQSYCVSANAQYGFIIVHRSSIQHFSQSHFSVFQLSVLKQSSGKLLWHKLYQNPRAGINLLYTNFNKNTLLKSAVGVQGFIDFCKNPQKNNNLHFKLGCGLGYIYSPFDKDKNFKNIAIGTHFNGLVQLGFYYHFQIRKNIAAIAGASLIHFSNGAIRTPNLGINIGSAGLAISYQKYMKSFQKPVHFCDSLLQKNTVEINCGIGLKQNYPANSTSFGVMACRIQYTFYNKLRRNVGAGFDIMNDCGLYRKMQEDNLIANNHATALQLGINVQYQQHISKFSIPIFCGYYLYSNYKGNGNFYHGLGLKYTINKYIGASLILKTHYAKADYFLWGFYLTV